MKFSSALKFNAISDWWDSYIAYDQLKRVIYQLEKEEHASRAYTDEEAGLLPSLDGKFRTLLDVELDKISKFYNLTAEEVFGELAGIEEEVGRIEEEWGEGEYRDYSDEDEESLDDEPSRRKSRAWSMSTVSEDEPGPSSVRRFASRLKDSISSLPGRDRSLSAARGASSSVARDVWQSPHPSAIHTRLTLKRSILSAFVKMNNLKSYVDVNETGFTKILKKYDKVTSSTLKPSYTSSVLTTLPTSPFTSTSKNKLTTALESLESIYTKCICKSNPTRARTELSNYKRENIVWERDTVWRTMLSRERRGASSPSTLPPVGTLKKPPSEAYIFKIPFLGFKVRGRLLSLLLALGVFTTLLTVPVITSPNPEEDKGTANRCFAILILSTLLWVLEPIPLFVTSLLVPFLLVVFHAVRQDLGGGEGELGEVLNAKDATKWVFSVMFSSTIMLLIGGFTISSALSKTAIDRILITRVLSYTSGGGGGPKGRGGGSPSRVLLSIMLVSCFSSMWISNVAAPTLCFSLVRPILRTLPPKAPFGPALVLGIALSANIGGLSSPISSPQNLIALGAMNPPLDWGRWFLVSIPVALISILLIWGLLLFSYAPASLPASSSSSLSVSASGGRLELKPLPPSKDPFTKTQYFVSFVCLVTIGLWCFAHQLEGVFGDMGIIGLIPIVIFFGTGVLGKDDFNQFTWTIVFLAMGGISLGKGVLTSGLLGIFDTSIRSLLSNLSLYTIVLLLSSIVLVISTFISHTISAVLLVPIAEEVGRTVGGGKSGNLLVFLTGLVCSCGMGMSVSGFPNQTAATQEDELGELYLSNVDFLRNGVPASVIATLVVATVGFLMMKVIGL